MASKKNRDKAITKTIDKLMKLINKQEFTVAELIVMYGNLGYHIGASIAGCSNTGPSLEELKKAYYSHPTVDVGLMLQGLLITNWEKDFLKRPELSTIAKHEAGKKEQ